MEKRNIKEALIGFHCPRYNELPNFDIYMDQVVSFINGHLDILNIDENDRSITSSMVNNYVKNSIVKAPIKKHYKRYHLAFLIVVSILKRAYSLNEITKMIEIQTNMNDSNIEVAYDTFAQYFESALHQVIEKGYASHDESENLDLHRQLLHSVVSTVALKIHVQIEIGDDKY